MLGGASCLEDGPEVVIVNQTVLDDSELFLARDVV